LKINELLLLITPPHNENYYGTYYNFLTKDFLQSLNSEALPAALGWINEHPPSHDQPMHFRRMINKVIKKSWEKIDEPGVLEALSLTILKRLSHFEEIFERGYHDDSSMTD